jgi:hypothetical protein
MKTLILLSCSTTQFINRANVGICRMYCRVQMVVNKRKGAAMCGRALPKDRHQAVIATPVETGVRYAKSAEDWLMDSETPSIQCVLRSFAYQPLRFNR